MDEQTDKKGASVWRWIALGSLATLLILAGTAYALIAYTVPRGRLEMVRMFQELVEQEPGGKIAPERLALLREMSVLAGRPDASFPSILLLTGVAEDALLDHQITDGEQRNLARVRDFVQAKNGAVTFSAMGALITEYPELKAILDRHTPPLPVASPSPAPQ